MNEADRAYLKEIFDQRKSKPQQTTYELSQQIETLTAQVKQIEREMKVDKLLKEKTETPKLMKPTSFINNITNIIRRNMRRMNRRVHKWVS